MKKSAWSLNFSTAAWAMIPVAIGINYVGKLFAGVLKLPLWLDSIGTILASILAGPIIGALAGAVNNVIYGLTADPVSFIYALTSIAIGLAAGVLAYKGWFESFTKASIAGIVIALVSTVVSTPINVALYEGQTGNLWGDALYAAIISATNNVWIASLLDEVVVDVPDKLIVALVCFGLYKALPKNIIQLYKRDEDIKRID